MYCFECGAQIRFVDEFNRCEDCVKDAQAEEARLEAELSECWSDYERTLEGDDVAYESDEMAQWDADIAAQEEAMWDMHNLDEQERNYVLEFQTPGYWEVYY